MTPFGAIFIAFYSRQRKGGMNKPLITIDMQLGEQLDLMLIFDTGRNGGHTGIVCGAAHCCQE